MNTKNVIVDVLSVIGFVSIFSLVYIRNFIFGPPTSPPPNHISTILIILGVVLTLPITITCLILGLIINKI